MRKRCIPSGLRTGGRYARYRRRREQAIEQARFEAVSWALAFTSLFLMLLMIGAALGDHLLFALITWLSCSACAFAMAVRHG